jgi:hypothetical protein
MLEKEAFAILTRKVWEKLGDKTKFSAELSTAIKRLNPKPFRKKVARMVLQEMSKQLQRTVTPDKKLSDSVFIEAIALAFECVATVDCPSRFVGYNPLTFAEMLIIQFCNAYAVLDAGAPTDNVLPDCRVTFTIPTYSAEALALREHLGTMPISEFGKYSIHSNNEPSKTRAS